MCPDISCLCTTQVVQHQRNGVKVQTFKGLWLVSIPAKHQPGERALEKLSLIQTLFTVKVQKSVMFLLSFSQLQEQDEHKVADDDNNGHRAGTSPKTISGKTSIKITVTGYTQHFNQDFLA